MADEENGLSVISGRMVSLMSHPCCLSLLIICWEQHKERTKRKFTRFILHHSDHFATTKATDSSGHEEIALPKELLLSSWRKEAYGSG